MKKIMLLGTLAGALALAGQAQAALQPLQGATITASYNGSDNVLGADHGFNAEAGSNVSALDAAEGLEFMSGDYLFAVDFSSTGLLTIWNNEAVAPGAYRLRFDFGTSLALPITQFTLGNTNAIGGLPMLTLIDGHTIALDLSGVEWRSPYTTFTAQIDAVAPADVPEPDVAALLLTGAVGLALARRRRKAG